MRRFPRLPARLDTVFSDSPVYFITFCTYRRRALLSTPLVHEAFLTFSRAAPEHQVAVGRYDLMPDHIHLFVAGDSAFRLGRWIGSLKQSLAKAIVRPETSDPIWQRGFFDHVLRSDESYAQKWDYVWANPVRAGLVSTPRDWPYAGEVVPIRHG
jgi:putative transposase